jgi:hypothetical protein
VATPFEPAVADLFSRHPYVVQPAAARILFPEDDETEQAKRTKSLFRALGTRHGLIDSQKLRAGYYVYRLSATARKQLALSPERGWPGAMTIRSRLAVLFFCSGGRRERVLLTPAELKSDFPELIVSKRLADHRYYFEQSPQGKPYRLSHIIVDTGQSAERVVQNCVDSLATRFDLTDFRGLISDGRFSLTVVTNRIEKKQAILTAQSRAEEDNPSRFDTVEIRVFVDKSYRKFFQE